MKNNGNEISVCWIKPQDIQLEIMPGNQSPLKNLFKEEGKILSYDAQVNFPCTSFLTVARQLQSALGERKLKTSILNLSAVPRNKFIVGNWMKDYLGKVYKKIQYGNSVIEARRIGKDISEIEDLDEIILSSNLIVIPSSFETHILELERTAKYLRKRYGSKVKLMASGTGIESHEEKLLQAGFDVVFVGAVTDRGEEILKAIVDENFNELERIPGVYSNLGDKRIRNLSARNFRQSKEKRFNEIENWKKRLPKYFNFVDIDFKLVGRPDLKASLTADPVISFCCSMQDLPFETISKTVSSGEKVVFAADDFFITNGCPRNCSFCHASGKGSSEKQIDYVLNLLDFYKKLGVTDLIPTDDQILLGAMNKEFAKNLIAIYEYAKKLGFTFFYGNGVETYALATFIKKSKSVLNKEEQKIYSKLTELFVDTASYIYLPYENIYGLSNKPKNSGLTKLALGVSGYESVLNYLNSVCKEKNSRMEIGSNIIFSEITEKEEIENYYKTMDSIIQNYPELDFRYNGFFIIPSNCAPHIEELKNKYVFFSDEHLELKVVSIPTVMEPDSKTEILEERLAWNINALNSSKSRRRLSNGTYS